MASKKCPHCQKEIDVKAKKCPHCQSDLRSWFSKHPILTVLLVLFIIGIVASAGGNKKSSSTTNKTDNQTTAQKIEAMKVDALEFVTEFDKNQLTAEEKYKEKLVELTAVIKNISEDIAGSPFLSLEPVGNKMFGTTIKCIFSDKSQLTTLENDNNVTIQGIVENQSLGIIQLKDCQILK